MAYMYVKDNKYYPFDNLGDDLADIRYSSSLGFEVDTLLAYPVAVLNNKGYITLQCCEGHPLSNVYYESVDEYKERMLNDNFDRDRMFEIRENDDGVKYVCFEGYPDTGAFVIFKRDIKLPSIPEGWDYQEDNSIRWNCDSFGNPTDYYMKLMCAVEKLTLWAEKLYNHDYRDIL